MSDSNRGGEHSLGLKRWVVPAALFAIALLGYGSVQNWLYYNDASTRAAAYASDANNQIAAECVVPQAALSCERQIDNAARKDQRDEYDLYSQKAMALWTGIMGAMAVIGIALSGVGVFLIWKTWDATRDAAENSRKTLRSFIAKERAYLIVQNVTETRLRKPDGTHDPGFIVYFLNGGHAPGTITIVQWSIVSEPFWPNAFEEMELVKRTAIPDGKARTPFMEDTTDLPKGAECYLVGLVTYETLEDEKFTTPFAFKMTRIQPEYSDDRFVTNPWPVHGMPHHT